MPFSIKDDELLEKYNKIWEKVKNKIKKEFETKPVYNEQKQSSRGVLKKKYSKNMQQMYWRKPRSKCDFNKVALALNEKYLKTKIKSCRGKINTNVHNNKIPKRGCQFFCLSVILIDSVFITGKIYYPQIFVEEGKVFANVMLKKKNA